MKQLFKSLVMLIIVLTYQLINTSHFAQNVGINSNGSAPNTKALLDIDASGMNPKGGLLIPRMTTAERNAITAPIPESLLIYNTTSQCFQTYIGSSWQNIFCGCSGSPSTPGGITGLTSVSSGQTNVSYSITSVSGATSYNWTLPSGASIISGQGSTNITVNFGSSNGNICVTASNSCGTSSTSCIAITVITCYTSGNQTFSFTGTSQSFIVPCGVTSLTVDVRGAQGGGASGGNGGRTQATLPVTAGETLNIYVGGKPTVQLGPGGFNGGGAVTALPCGGGSDGWPGGGASDIRRGTTFTDRLIVAGGGGGMGWSTGLGGAGGGTNGVDGAASWIAGTNGKGGTQVAGGLGGFYTGNGQSAPNGTLGVGGNSGPVNTYCTGGGGGGGYYGGGGGYVSAGGGGSSLIPTGGNSTSNFQTGNGQILISW